MIGDKTLVAWVSPANLEQQGGGVLALMNGEAFDALVLGEKERGKWMAGSDFFRRTQADQTASPVETAQAGQFVAMAVVYAGSRITLYRNGQRYSDYDAGGHRGARSDSAQGVGDGAGGASRELRRTTGVSWRHRCPGAAAARHG